MSEKPKLIVLQVFSCIPEIKVLAFISWQKTFYSVFWVDQSPECSGYEPGKNSEKRSLNASWIHWKSSPQKVQPQGPDYSTLIEFRMLGKEELETLAARFDYYAMSEILSGYCLSKICRLICLKRYGLKKRFINLSMYQYHLEFLIQQVSCGT